MDNNIISKPALMRFPENGKKKRERPKSPWVTYCQRTCKISRWWDDMGRPRRDRRWPVTHVVGLCSDCSI